MNLHQSQDMTSIWMILQLSGSGHAAALPIFDAHLHMFGWVFNLGCLQGRSHHCHTHLSHKIQGPLLEQASLQSLGGSRMSYRKIIRLVWVNSGGQHCESFLLFTCNPGFTCFVRIDPTCIWPLDKSKVFIFAMWDGSDAQSCFQFMARIPASSPSPTGYSEVLDKSFPPASETRNQFLIKCRTPMMAHCLFWVQAWTYCWTSSYFRSTGFLTYKLAHHFQIEAAAKPCQSLPGSSPVSNPSKKHIGELDWTDLWSSCCLEDENLSVEKYTQVGPINFSLFEHGLRTGSSLQPMPSR